MLERTDVGSPSERDLALGEVAPILGAMGESASRDDLIRQVAERLDLEPAMVMGRVTAARPTVGGTQAKAASPREPEPVIAPRPSAELTSRERRERALLAMCVAMPEEGNEFLTRLTPEHLSPMGGRALAWIREHPTDLASNLPTDDNELAGMIAELVMVAAEQPASVEAMELNFLLLEQRRLEGEIAAAGQAEETERRAELSKERAALVERIAHAERVG